MTFMQQGPGGPFGQQPGQGAPPQQPQIPQQQQPQQMTQQAPGSQAPGSIAPWPTPTPPWAPIPPQPPTPAPEPPPGGGGPNLDIQTTINPRPVYNQALTQQAGNQQRAMAQQAAAPDFLRKALGAKAGVGTGAGHLGASMGQMAQLMTQASSAVPQQQWKDAQTNAQSILRGQTEREREAQGIAKPLLDLSLGRDAMSIQQQQQLIGLLSRIFPNIWEMLGGGLDREIQY